MRLEAVYVALGIGTDGTVSIPAGLIRLAGFAVRAVVAQSPIRHVHSGVNTGICLGAFTALLFLVQIGLGDVEVVSQESGINTAIPVFWFHVATRHTSQVRLGNRHVGRQLRHVDADGGSRNELLQLDAGAGVQHLPRGYRVGQLVHNQSQAGQLVTLEAVTRLSGLVPCLNFYVLAANPALV
ncbi:hypothetical protein D3C80_1429840 [compost metagenome]